MLIRRPVGKIRELVVEYEPTHRAARTKHRLDGRRHRHDVTRRIHYNKVTRTLRLTRRVHTTQYTSQLPGRRRRAHMVANQACPFGEISWIEHALHRYRDELRIGHVTVAVGVHEPARLREEEPRLRIRRPAVSDVGVIQHREELQQVDAARW